MEFLEITSHYTVSSVTRDSFAKDEIVIANKDFDSLFLIHKVHHVTCHIVSVAPRFGHYLLPASKNSFVSIRALKSFTSLTQNSVTASKSSWGP
jgi:hypothetical protein